MNDYTNSAFYDALEDEEGLDPEPMSPAIAQLLAAQDQRPQAVPAQIATRESAPPPGPAPLWLPDDMGVLTYQALKEEIGTPPTDAGFFEKAWGGITDVAGNFLDRTGDALSYPSDRLEQLAGLYYYNDIPDLSKRWEMGQLTWEMATDFGNRGQFREDARIAAMQGDEALQKFVEENEGGWGALLMSLVMDPLNLLGMPGAGYAARGASAGLKALGLSADVVKGTENALRLANRGFKIGDLRVLAPYIPEGIRPASDKLVQGATRLVEAVPGAKPLLEMQMRTRDEAMYRRLFDLHYGAGNQASYRHYVDASRRKFINWSMFKHPFTQTPESYADEMANAGMSVTMDILHNTSGMGVKNFRDAQRFSQAIATGDLAELVKFQPAFAHSKPLKRFAEAMSAEVEAWRGTGKEIDPSKWKSMQMDFDDPAQVAAAQGLKVVPSPEEARKAWESQFMHDYQGVMVPAMQHFVGIGADLKEVDGRLFAIPRELNAAEKGRVAPMLLYDTYKKGLTMFYLNRPGFMWLNVIGNTTMAAVDGHGLAVPGRLSDKRLQAWGFDPATIRETVSDRKAHEKILGTHLAEGAAEGQKWYRPLKSWTPFVQYAAQHDQMTRMHITVKAAERLVDDLLDFENKQRAYFPGAFAMPDIPGLDNDTLKLLEGRFRATKATPEGINTFIKELSTNQLGVTPEFLVRRALEARGYQGDALKLAEESFGGNFMAQWDDMVAEGVDPRVAADALRADDLRDLLTHYDVTPQELFTAFGRNPNTQQLRVMNLQIMRKEREDLGESVLRYMKFQGYEQRDILAMTDVLRESGKLEEAEWAKLFSVLDNPAKGDKARNDAYKSFEKFRQSLRGQLGDPKKRGTLYKSGLDVLSRNPAATDAARIWRTVLELDQGAQKGARELMFDTLKKTKPLDVKPPTKAEQDAAKAARVELTHQTRRADKIRRGGYEAEGAVPPATLEETEAEIHRLRTIVDDFDARTAGSTSANDERDAFWREYFTARDTIWSNTLDLQLDALGVSRIPKPRLMPEPGVPDTTGGRKALFDLRDEVMADIATMTDIPARELNPQQVAALRRWAREQKPLAADIRHVALQVGRAMADFTMHNYAHRLGIDEILKYPFPFHFWTSRTLAKWGMRTMERPAATAAWVKLLTFQNQELDIPERLKNKIRIPVPFLPEWMGGGIYMDPLQVMFPYAYGVRGDTFEHDEAGPFTQVTDALSAMGLSPSPFVSIPLAMAAPGGGDRAQYINFQMNGFPWLFPGTKAQRAISHFLAGSPEETWADEVDGDALEKLTLGFALPEPQIREFLGLPPGDHWDGYRIVRMVANLVGQGEITPEQGLHAIRNRRGPEWEQAKQYAATENGLRDLSQWLFGMAGTIYPKGEAMQRGLKRIYDLARDADAKGRKPGETATAAFFDAFPEYQVRQVASQWYNGKEAVEREVDTALFYIDMEKINDEFNPQIQQLEYYKSRGLKVGQELSGLYDAKRNALDNLDKTYSKRSKSPTVYMAPHDRAMYLLREQYYNLGGESFEETKALQQNFLRKLVGRGKETTYYDYARQADAIIAEWQVKIDAEKGSRDKLYKERNQRIESLTQQAITEISARDFLNYLETSKKEPTEGWVEEVKSRDALRMVMRGVEGPLPDLVIKRYGTHPDPVIAGQIDAVNDWYYALGANSLAREDYARSAESHLNELRARVGLPPLEAVRRNPTPAPAAGVSYGDPVAQAIAASQAEAGMKVTGTIYEYGDRDEVTSVTENGVTFDIIRDDEGRVLEKRPR